MTRNWKRFATIAFSAIVIISASVGIVRYYTDHLLRSDATSRAENWAAELAGNVSDLPKIIRGALPSDESVVFFEQARAIGDVWKYRIFDSTGQLVLVSNQIGLTNSFTERMPASDFSALSQQREGEILVHTRNGIGPREPGFIAEAIMPIRVAGKQIGFLSILIDETARQNFYFTSAVQMALALCGLILLAFGVPTAGFLLRSRQKERAETHLQHLAFHDSLTGLMNRHAITQCLESLFESSGAAQEIAVHVVDLDNFKEINDTLGHDVGDDVLRQVSSRLARVVAGEGEVGRIGGDEFLIVQSGAGAAARAEDLARRLVETLLPPCKSGDSLLQTSLSVGTAIYPADGETASDLLKSADIAVYFAKAEGRACYRLFRPTMDEQLKRRRNVEQKIRAALSGNGFKLYFQPLYNLANGRIEGVEALLRLPDGMSGMIPPSEFIPIAEDIGLIGAVGGWVIAEGCRSLKLLPSGMKLAINLSPIQFEKGDIVATIAQALRESGADPSRLELEVTENLLLKDTPAIQEKMVALKALGVSIVLDDFGAGYSSLNYLWRYPFDKIKIDRCFVSSIGGNTQVEAIIESIIHLSRKLKMQVTAEGVETAEQAAMLRTMQCDQVQGFLFSKPMPMVELAQALLHGFIGHQTAAERFATPQKTRIAVVS